MPYARRGYSGYRKSRYGNRSHRAGYRTSNNQYKTIKRVARAEIRREDKKDHPLRWVDVKYTGEYVKTTPSLLSFSEAIKNQIQSTGSYVTWPVRNDSADGGILYRQANVYCTGFNYQLRFQQNSEAVDVTTSTIRNLFYSFNDTYTENSNPILDGGDIDQPPDTRDIMRMYSDKIRTLRAGITETTTDDDAYVPGQTILKGWKKLYHKFTMDVSGSPAVVATKEGGDIRHEMQSDDNSSIGEIEIYGFVRIYYRVMA